MNWEKLDVHLENLVPGLATVWAISLFWNPADSASNGSGVIVSVALIGVAYLLGVVVNVLSRLLLDRPSQKWTRAWVFRKLGGLKLENVESATRDQINEAYNLYCTIAIEEEKATAVEVAKRRQTARLLRSALVPGIILIWHLLSTTFPLHGMIGLTLITYFLVLLLYGFAELTILDEAYHSVPPNKRSIPDSEHETKKKK